MILGCWVHALLFRRPIFSILDAVFKEGQGLGKHDVFCLSRQALNELQLLTVMAPMAHSDLRAQHSEFLFRTDASPWGGAVCKAKVGAAVAQELWRHCEQKGFYTRLESPISSILSEKGLDHCGNLFGHSDFDSAIDPQANIPMPLTEGYLYDAIEIFRGVGDWSAAHSAMGLSVHDGVGANSWMDLGSMSLFRELAALAFEASSARLARWNVMLEVWSSKRAASKIQQ